MTFIIQQRIDARKAIARGENLIKQLKSADRHAILRVIAVERAFLRFDFGRMSLWDAWDKIAEIRHAKITGILTETNTIEKLAEMMPTVPGAPDQYVRPNSIPTFNKLLGILEQNLNQERNSIMGDKKPSANDIKRWAIKAAVLDYYKEYNIPAENVADFKVTDSVGSNKTISQLAPNKKAIYDKWLQRLEAQTRVEDKYKLSMEEYNEAVQRGTPRGGAFEKMLDRYREQFMAQLWQQHNQEENDARS